jgi:hypothetical protein
MLLAGKTQNILISSLKKLKKKRAADKTRLADTILTIL